MVGILSRIVFSLAQLALPAPGGACSCSTCSCLWISTRFTSAPRVWPAPALGFAADPPVCSTASTFQVLGKTTTITNTNTTTGGGRFGGASVTRGGRVDRGHNLVHAELVAQPGDCGAGAAVPEPSRGLAGGDGGSGGGLSLIHI